MDRQLPPNVRAAILSGPIPKLRDWRSLPVTELTRAEKIMAFAETHLKVPEGSLVGNPIHLEPFQEAFIYAVFDNPHMTRTAVLSIARKNSKTVTCAIILLAFIIGPEALENSMIASGAMAREQASIVFRHMQKFIELSPELRKLAKPVPSTKKIFGLAKNVEYSALAKDGSRAVGRSDRVVLGDEWGQIIGATDDFVEALLTGQGAFDDALAIIISTQAASDTAYLSMVIDDAERSNDPTIVCHVYTSTKDCDLMDETEWARSNPALDIFRSRKDVMNQMTKATRLPAMEAKMRNLILNQRVAQENLFVSPSIWIKNNRAPNLDLFREPRIVTAGLDLSKKHDLTACVLAVEDDESVIHLQPFVFTPSRNIEERAKRDRAPYDVWIRDGHLIPLGGDVVDYAQVCNFLQDRIDEEEFHIDTITFDRWRIKEFQKACEEEQALGQVVWEEFGQGFKDMAPACQALLEKLIDGKIRHGAHPLLNYGIANAIAVQDPAGNLKLDKSKSTARIDMIVAAVMAVGSIERSRSMRFDAYAMIG